MKKSGPTLTGQWFVRHVPRPHASQVLFCFPHAGGNASTFRDWSRELPETIQVAAVQLPGRDHRRSEKLILGMRELVVQLIPPIRDLADGRPFAFFGHSLGALVAYALTRSSTDSVPCHLYLSGRNAPSHRRRGDPPSLLHECSDHELSVELRRMGGTPFEVLDNQELMEILLPVIRADLTIAETYVQQPDPRISVPVSVFGGSDDSLTTRAGLEAWRLHTTGAFQCRMFPGDHFFFLQHRRSLWNVMERDWSRKDSSDAQGNSL